MSSPGHWWRWPLLVLLVGFVLACVSIYQIAWLSGDLSDPVEFALSLMPLMWAVPGVVVIRRADWHPVGWMLLAVGCGYCIVFDLNAAVVVWDKFIPLSRPWAAWIADGWGNVSPIALTAILLTLFPDGLVHRPPGERRWGWTRIGAAIAAIVVAASGTDVGGYEGNTFAQNYPNPTGFGMTPPALAGWMVLPLLVVIAAALYSVWRRSRSANEAEGRQYKWVLFPFGTLFAMIPVAIVLSSLIGNVVWLPVVFMYFIIPIAFSIAIVRYRWFDIDRIVSRAVTYGVVGVVVVAVYSVPVLVFPAVLGLSSDLSVAGATLAAAAVFNPLRRRVQRWVGRRFNRARYDAERVVAAFSGRLQNAVDLRRVTEELGRAVGTALRPSAVFLWFGASGSTR